MDRRSFLAMLPAFSGFRKLRFEQLRKSEQFRLDQEETPVAVVRYPYLQNVRGDRATIMWSTFDTGYGEVEYSSDGINFQVVSARRETFFPNDTYLSYPFTQYQAVLPGLTPGTRYLYRAMVNGQPVNLSGDGHFRTAGTGPFSFLVIGDSGQGRPEQFNIASRMATEQNLSFMLHTGDLAYYSGLHSQYNANYFAFYQSLMSALPVFATPGNHDCETAGGKAYLSVHSFPTENITASDHNRYYSFDWGNAHVVMIDSAVSLNAAINGGGPMLRWLENDLQSTRQFWRIAVVHHPPYATGPNEAFVEPAWVLRYVVPILEANGVQIVFSGDEHSFQRSRWMRGNRVVPDNRGTIYFTSGGGGANLYAVDLTKTFMGFGASEHHYLRVDINGTQMRVRAIRQNGLELDRVTISPQPILAADGSAALAAGPAATPVSYYPMPGGGTLVRIVGHSLAAQETTACEFPAPQEMAGSFVTVNGQRLPLYYVSHDQIYAELPAGATGRIALRVTTPNGSADIVSNVP